MSAVSYIYSTSRAHRFIVLLSTFYILPSLHQLQHILQRIKITRVCIYIQNTAVTVNQFVCRERIHTKKTLNSRLLFRRQIVMDNVFT